MIDEFAVVGELGVYIRNTAVEEDDLIKAGEMPQLECPSEVRGEAQRKLQPDLAFAAQEPGIVSLPKTHVLRVREPGRHDQRSQTLVTIALASCAVPG